jgi:hypothetical protein
MALQYITDKYNEINDFYLFRKSKDNRLRPYSYTFVCEFADRVGDGGENEIDLQEPHNKNDVAQMILQRINYGDCAWLLLAYPDDEDEDDENDANEARGYNEMLIVFTPQDNDFFRGLKTFLNETKKLCTKDPSEFKERLLKKYDELDDLGLKVKRVMEDYWTNNENLNPKRNESWDLTMRDHDPQTGFFLYHGLCGKNIEPNKWHRNGKHII